ncbi:hypothetical protein ACERIT_13515 [Halopenitus sp. H-Gu1]|uniref:hypothetical protein n=1 Tax=Halopenitus sp. H-Gu1 TaxID=3242697 RepID=UPI00359D636D
MFDHRLVAVGISVTTFLVVAGAITAALESRIAFSVLVGLPVGILVGLLAGLLASRMLPELHRTPRSILQGAAVVGPIVVGLFAVRYVIAAARSILTGRIVIAIALLAGAIVAVIGLLRE